MKNFVFAACPQIRNVIVCGLVTFALSACGAGGESSSSGTTAGTSEPATSLVSPNVGLIDRTPVEQSDDTTTQGTTSSPGTSTAATTPGSTNTSIATPVPGTPASGSGSSATTVASNDNPPSSQMPSTGTATLDWTPPTQNSDGSVLTDLAGYTVYYGTSPGNLTEKVKITNPGLSAYTMTNLASGTWYFAVASYSSAGAESALSGVINTKI
jgi:hypothetical protein